MKRNKIKQLLYSNDPLDDVVVMGWVRTRRDAKDFSFLEVNDGSCLKNIQIIGLSATIGNPEELAEWLDAKLVIDNWRPVRLDKGVYLDGEVDFR